MSKAAKIGIVTGNKMDKTVVVAVERLVRHPLYKRSFKKTSTFLAHDEANRCQVGDRVRIVESRPLSKLKRWRVADVLSSSKIAEEPSLDEEEAGAGVTETP